MTDTVWASLVTAVGMLATTITAAIVQYLSARFNSEDQATRELARLQSETFNRRSEQRYDRIIDQLSELMVIVDPDINPTIDRAELARLIVGTQMLLNPKVEVEGQLNGALTKLGMLSTTGDPANRLHASDDVIRACQTFVSVHHRT